MLDPVGLLAGALLILPTAGVNAGRRLAGKPRGGDTGNIPGLGCGQVRVYRDEGAVERDELVTVTVSRS